MAGHLDILFRELWALKSASFAWTPYPICWLWGGNLLTGTSWPSSPTGSIFWGELLQATMPSRSVEWFKGGESGRRGGVVYDIVDGVWGAIANRNRSEIEGLIGFFVITPMVWTDMSDNPTFRELLARTRQATLEACEHQDKNSIRTLNQHPLFQVMFNDQEIYRMNLQLSDLNVLPIKSLAATESSMFDITLFATKVVYALPSNTLQIFLKPKR